MTTTLSKFGKQLHKMTEEHNTAHGASTEPGKQVATLEIIRHEKTQQQLCKLRAHHVEHMMQTEELLQRQIELEASRTRYSNPKSKMKSRRRGLNRRRHTRQYVEETKTSQQR